MLDLNSQMGFGFITRQIGGRFTAPQPSNPHVASGYRVYPIHSPYWSLTVSTSERGVPLDLLAFISQTYLRIPQKDPSIPLSPIGQSLLELV